MSRSPAYPLLVALALLAPVGALAQHHEAHDVGVPPAQSLKLLKDGNQRFVLGKPKHGDERPTDRKALAAGQHPHAIVLSCSDSRVPPELVFDQGLGKLFVVRVAGNVADPEGLASIEYAVEHLGAHFIVVMGHESCGAVKATLSTPVGKSAGSPSLDTLVSDIRKNLGGATAAEDDKVLARPVRANVEAVVANLKAGSPILKERLEKGELAIAPAVYGLATGKVEFWDVDKLSPAPASH